MDTLFHFIFSIIVGMALAPKIKHKIELVALAAFLSILIDIDHFLGFLTRGTFHNIFVFLFLPFLLFLIAFIYERKKGAIILQTFFLLLLVMLSGHVVSDTFTEGKVALFYPFSTKEIGMISEGSRLLDSLHPAIIHKEGIGLAFYFLILAGAAFIEDFIYFFEKQHEKVSKALKDTFSDFF